MLAPTGTIAFLMDCDTTGVEPDIALVKYKLLAGGGMLKIVNRGVPDALRRLGYGETEITTIIAHIEKHDTIEDVEENGQTIASGLKPEHLPVFDCAFKAAQRQAQHRLHGASENDGRGAAVHQRRDFQDRQHAERLHRRGCPQHLHRSLENGLEMRGDLSRRLEAFAAAQHEKNQRRRRQDRRRGRRLPRSKAASRNFEAEIARLQAEAGKPLRRRLSDTRQALTHKFDIAGHEGYLTVGLFEDGQPGELFITMAKEGSTIGGLMDSIGTLTSIAFQYGVPLEALARKFAHQRFEPSGFTKNPEIRNASSITDYVFRWLALQFVPGYRESVTVARTQPELAMPGLIEEMKKKINRPVPELPIAEETDILEVKSEKGHGRGQAKFTLTSSFQNQGDAPTCPTCGHVAVRNGACYKCLNCGESLGCS